LVDEDDGGVGGQRRAAIEGALKKSLEKMIMNEVPLVHALCNREVLKAMIDDLDEGCTRKLTRELRRKQVKSDKSGADVAEVYSPPRMSKMASQLGYSEGFALDLTTNDEEGRPWNLADKECQERALKLQDETKPWMLTASPPCTMFSTLQNISLAKRDADEVKGKLEDAMMLLSFAALMCIRQAKQGRKFMLEHPVGASSWSTAVLNKLYFLEGAQRVNFDFCMGGMKSSKGAEATLSRSGQE